MLFVSPDAKEGGKGECREQVWFSEMVRSEHFHVFIMKHQAIVVLWGGSERHTICLDWGKSSSFLG